MSIGIVHYPDFGFNAVQWHVHSDPGKIIVYPRFDELPNLNSLEVWKHNKYHSVDFGDHAMIYINKGQFRFQLISIHYSTRFAKLPMNCYTLLVTT